MEKNPMIDIKELFERRKTAFQTMTDALFQRVPNFTNGATQFFKELQLVTPMSGVKLTWLNIEYGEQEQIVAIVGVMEYEPGAEVQFPSGEKVEVDEDTAPYFTKAIRASVPMDIALSTNVDEVIEYLDTIHKEEQQKLQEAEDALVHGMEAQAEDENMGLTQDALEFNLENLSDDQLEQLKLFEKTHTNKN